MTQGTKLFRVDPQTATTAALAWTITIGDDSDCKRIVVNFASAPTSTGALTVTIKSNLGTAYDCIVFSASMIGRTGVCIPCIEAIPVDDYLLVEYANPDSVSITGVATVQL